jgi:hypothetical protein
VSQEFGANEPLQAAYDFISQQVGTGVKLSTAYPRRTFTPDQMAMSFKDLQLAPSAAIIVVPVCTNTVIINIINKPKKKKKTRGICIAPTGKPIEALVRQMEDRVLWRAVSTIASMAPLPSKSRD